MSIQGDLVDKAMAEIKDPSLLLPPPPPPPPPPVVLLPQVSTGATSPSDDRSDAHLEAFERALVRRHSMPVVAPSSLGTESVIMRTTVKLTGIEERGDHCVYIVEVDTLLEEKRILFKRYSEIRAFRMALFQLIASSSNSKTTTDSGTVHGPCRQLTQLVKIAFPHRRLQFPGFHFTTGIGTARDRIRSLETFLEAVLLVFRTTSRRNMRLCMNADCAIVETTRQFFQVDEPVGSTQDRAPQDDDDED